MSTSSTSELAREVLLVLATLVVGAVLVAALLFLPLWPGRDFEPTFDSFGRYLARVGSYLGGLLRGELGTNARSRSANPELFEAARRSLELLAVSLVVALVLGLAWGALLATVRRGPLAALLLGLSSVLISLPSFTVMLLLPCAPQPLWKRLTWLACNPGRCCGAMFAPTSATCCW